MAVDEVARAIIENFGTGHSFQGDDGRQWSHPSEALMAMAKFWMLKKDIIDTLNYQIEDDGDHERIVPLLAKIGEITEG